MEAAAEGRGIGHGPQPHTHTHTHNMHFVFVHVPVPLNVHFPLLDFMCAHEFALTWLFNILDAFVSVAH